MTTSTDHEIPAEEEFEVPSTVVGLLELARKFQNAGHRPSSDIDAIALSRRWMRIAP